jgi:hypothetical protein
MRWWRGTVIISATNQVDVGATNELKVNHINGFIAESAQYT